MLMRLGPLPVWLRWCESARGTGEFAEGLDHHRVLRPRADQRELT